VTPVLAAFVSTSPHPACANAPEISHAADGRIWCAFGTFKRTMAEVETRIEHVEPDARDEQRG